MKSAIIIGGGFYGCSIAIYLARQGWNVQLIEKEDALLKRASYVNQARLHNGYHYPRSFQTAIRSRANLPAFKEIYPASVFEAFKPLYAIARYESKVSPSGFVHFCNAGNIPLKKAAKEDQELFDQRLVEAVFEVEEPAFNANALKESLYEQMLSLPIGIHLDEQVEAIQAGRHQEILVKTEQTDYVAELVFNCTYAALNHVGAPNQQKLSLQHKISEVILVKPPAALQDKGITLMDGQFFSIMPFPARGLHSLTHVRHTHHVAWQENKAQQRSPYQLLNEYLSTGVESRSKYPWMIRDAQRYVPAISQIAFVESLFDVKTLITKTAIDDARPILFHRHQQIPNLVSILGGKIDNIFDILEYVERLLPESTQVSMMQEQNRR